MGWPNRAKPGGSVGQCVSESASQSVYGCEPHPRIWTLVLGLIALTLTLTLIRTLAIGVCRGHSRRQLQYCVCGGWALRHGFRLQLRGNYITTHSLKN